MTGPTAEKKGLGLVPRLYVYALSAVGAGILALTSITWAGDASLQRIALAAGLATLIALAAAFPFPLRPRIKANVATAPVLVAVLLLAPPVAAAAAAIGICASGLLLRRDGHRILFNSAAAVIYAGAAGMVRTMLAGDVSFFSVPGGLIASTLAAGTVFILNHAAVMGATALETHKNPLRQWLKEWRTDLGSELALCSLGYGAAFATFLAPWALAFFVAPVVVIHYAFSSIVALTSRLQAQMEQLKATEAKLIHAQKLASVGTMATGVSHQINNPVFAVKGRAELLLAGADRHLGTEKARQHVESIRDMAERVSQVIKCMLTQSKPTEDGAPCADINESLESVLTLLEQKLSASRVEVIRDYQEDLPFVPGAPVRIQEAFSNLIQNACDAMPGGGTLRLRTRLECSTVSISISDTGTGIPESSMAHLFEPFFTTRGKQGGTGLGLFVAKSMTDNLEGSIEVQSQPGKGTTFAITLPTGERAIAKPHSRELAVIGREY